MATPHVAGVAALWAQKLTGQLNGQLLADRLVGTAATTGMKAGFDPGDIGAGEKGVAWFTKYDSM